MTPKTFQVGIKAVILDRGRLLALKKAGGGWDLPGGRMDDGELFVDTLEREIGEELPGTELLTMGNLLHAGQMPDLAGLGLVLLLYQAQVRLPADGIVLSEEHEEYRWVSPHEARSLNSRAVSAAAFALQRQ